MEEEVLMLVVFVVFVAGGLTLMMVAMTNRRHLREIAHRERLAMIERGLVPAPEADPARFEAATGLDASRDKGPVPGERFRTVGVAMIGVGVGLVLLIGLSGGSPDVGLGIGGAWVALGAASLLNYFLISRERRR